MEKENKKVNSTENSTVEYKDPAEEQEVSFDDLEPAPEELGELFEEPPILDLDFDEEPSDDELKLEEMNVENLDEDV